MPRETVKRFFEQIQVIIDKNSLVPGVSSAYFDNSISRMPKEKQGRYLEYIAEGIDFYATLAEYIRQVDSFSQADLKKLVDNVHLRATALFAKTTKPSDSDAYALALETFKNELDSRLNSPPKHQGA